jgi:hypothetical protein
METKLCINCKHHDLLEKSHICTIGKNFVTGDVLPVDCTSMRIGMLNPAAFCLQNICGVNAELFEPSAEYTVRIEAEKKSAREAEDAAIANAYAGRTVAE